MGIVRDGDAEEVAFAVGLFWLLTGGSGVDGGAGGGRSGEMVDCEALVFGQCCSELG